MKLGVILMSGILAATIGTSVMAASNASVQSGKLSIEGTVYNYGNIGLSFEYGINSKIGLYGGSNELVPGIGLKFAIPDQSSLSDASFKVGVIKTGVSLGLDWHYKLNKDVRFFADGSINTYNNEGFYPNLAAGLAFNINKNAAITAQVRSIDHYSVLGIGARFTF